MAKRRFSYKKIQDNAPVAAGGVLALAAGGTIDGIIPTEDKRIKGAVKTVAGLAIIAMFNNKLADGFGTVLAATGAGQLVNGFMKADQQIPGLGGAYEDRHRIYRYAGKTMVNVV